MSDEQPHLVDEYRDALRATIGKLDLYRSAVRDCIRALDAHEAREPYQTLQLIDQRLRGLVAEDEQPEA